MSAAAYRAGIVAILGPPNAGKSTLLNHALGEKLAIVSAKPQTTRSRILGILTREDAQIIFQDTPGLHESTKVLNATLNEQVAEAADRCDAALVLADLTRGWTEVHETLHAGLVAAGTPCFAVGTKCDLAGARGAEWPPPNAEASARISAKTGENVEALLDSVAAVLPESPALYPEDELSDRPVRFLAAELVREAAFDVLSQELPYSLAVEIEQFDESRPDIVKIRANLIVERQSQKQIVIGRAGAVIKRIGIQARKGIEALIECKVHLELWVKVEPKWAKRPNRIKSLGYS
jgi:GTP-binding protein Era